MLRMPVLRVSLPVGRSARRDRDPGAREQVFALLPFHDVVSLSSVSKRLHALSTSCAPWPAVFASPLTAASALWIERRMPLLSSLNITVLARYDLSF